jgi:hypothetical protein
MLGSFAIFVLARLGAALDRDQAPSLEKISAGFRQPIKDDHYVESARMIGRGDLFTEPCFP